MTRACIPVSLFVSLFIVVHISSAQTALLKDIETTYQYDDVGNVKWATRSTSDGYTDTHQVTYQYNPQRWLMSMPQLTVDSSSTPTSSEPPNNTVCGGR